MAERATRNPERTRQAIIDAALGELIEKGPVNLTIGEVARRAGVTPGALSAHFVNREGLLTAAFEAAIAQVQADAPNLRTLADLQFATPEATHDEMVHIASQLSTPQSALNRRLILEGLLQARHSRQLNTLMQPGSAQWVRDIAAKVRVSQEAGRTRNDISAEAIALVWLSNVMGLTAIYGVINEEFGPDFASEVQAAADIASHAFDVERGHTTMPDTPTGRTD